VFSHGCQPENLSGAGQAARKKSGAEKPLKAQKSTLRIGREASPAEN
jgi:hypothetical protein